MRLDLAAHAPDLILQAPPRTTQSGRSRWRRRIVLVRNASRSLFTAGFAHPSGTTFGVSVFMGETPTRRDVPFSWFGSASVSRGIDALQMMLHCG
jgi:hypothetical protein